MEPRIEVFTKEAFERNAGRQVAFEVMGVDEIVQGGTDGDMSS